MPVKCYRFLPLIPALAGLALSSPCQGQSAQDEYEAIRHEQLRSIVQSVLTDADTRTSLLADDVTAGWDGHFFVQSADGNYRLELQGQIQTQFILNRRDDSGVDDTRYGFQVRRLKLATVGHLIDPSLKFKISINANPFISATLSDGYVEKSFENGFKLRVGQFKPRFLFEQITSSKRQLAVDRSLVSGRRGFDQNRTIGVELSHRDESVGWAVLYHNGFDRDNRPALTEDTEYAFAGRIEYLAAGSWGQFRDFSSWPGEPFAAQIGAAINIAEDEYGTAAGPEEQRIAWTADLSLEFGGASFFASWLAIHSNADGEPDLNRYAAVVQGGVFLADDLEVFARYEWGDLDEPGVAHLSVLTLGFNRYFHKHDLKWTTDIGFGLNEVALQWRRESAGWLADPTGEDGQIVIRSQFQLVF